MIKRIPKNRPPTSPGEMLAEEFLIPLRITQTAFAKRINVRHARLNEIINGKRGVTIDTALRFAKALNTSPEFWLNLQLAIDVYEAIHSKNSSEIDKIKPIHRELLSA